LRSLRTAGSSSPAVSTSGVQVALDSHQTKLRRHHANDDVAFPVQTKRASDNLGVRAEAPVPELMAEDNDGLLPDLVVARLKGAPAFRCDPSNAKKVGAPPPTPAPRSVAVPSRWQ
jgi:hypothetical protein